MEFTIKNEYANFGSVQKAIMHLVKSFHLKDFYSIFETPHPLQYHSMALPHLLPLAHIGMVGGESKSSFILSLFMFYPFFCPPGRFNLLHPGSLSGAISRCRSSIC